MTDNKRTFTVKVGEQETKLDVQRPSHRVKTRGDMVYAKRLQEAASEGVPVQLRMEKLMRDQGLWDDEKRAKFEECHSKLLEGEKKLLMGGNAGLTKKAAKELAIQMRRYRVDLRTLTSERNQLFSSTAEAFAEQARFNYLVAACTVYEKDGKPYFKDADDYLARAGDDEVATKAADTAAKLFYGLDKQEEFLKNLPENAFLRKYRFANEEGHLMDERERLVDTSGRLVDGDGQLINERGELVDEEGNLVTETGEPKVEFAEFLEEPAAETAVAETAVAETAAA